MRRIFLIFLLIFTAIPSAYSQRMTVITEDGKSYRFLKMVNYSEDGQFKFKSLHRKDIILAQHSIKEVKIPGKWGQFGSGIIGSYFLFALYMATKEYGYGRATIPMAVGIAGLSGLIYYIMPKRKYCINKMSDDEIELFVKHILNPAIL